MIAMQRSNLLNFPTSPSSNLHSRLRSVFSIPNLTSKCAELKKLFAQCSGKDLESIFLELMAEIFGSSAGGIGQGWNVVNISRRQHYREFHAVAEFLSSAGPMMDVCYKIMQDPQAKFDFRTSSKFFSVNDDGPAATFFSRRMKQYDQEQKSIVLLLTPFEYFYFSFALLLTQYQNGSTMSNWVAGEALYPQLFEDYMAHFLPCDGSDVKRIEIGGFGPAPTMGPMNQLYLSSPQQSPTSPLTPPKSTLLKQNALSLHSFSEANNTFIPSAAGDFSHDRNWRSESITLIFSELWLSYMEENDTTNFSFTSSPKSSNLPSADLVRVVRMFIKHCHFFANSVSSNDLIPLDSLKRNIVSMIKKRLYHFLMHTTLNWPYDASFRLVLETWLSYIQPWRYVNGGQNMYLGGGGDRGDDGDGKIVHPERWQGFVEENVIFYTTLLRHQLQRFSRLDLTSNKNAYMLFRICKVYSQENMMGMVKRADAKVDQQHDLYRGGIGGGGGMVVKQNVADVMGLGYTYVSVFESGFYDFLAALLGMAQNAKDCLESQKSSSEATSSKNDNILWSFLGFGNTSSPDVDVDEITKSIQYLGFIVSQLSSLFSLPLPEPSRPELRSKASSPSDVDSDDELSISPRQRWKIVNRRAKSHPMPLGNPDELPVRSDEIAFLVRFFFALSGWINSTYRHQIADLYNRTDLVGYLVRLVLQPPSSYIRVEKSLIGVHSPRVREHLPARLSLRPLASYRVVVFAGLWYFLTAIKGYSVINSTVFVFMVMSVLVIGHVISMSA